MKLFENIFISKYSTKDHNVIKILGIKFKFKIKKTLIENMYKQIIRIDKMQDMFNFQLMNKMKENGLKIKVANGQKVKVFFVIAQPSKFGMESIYREMVKSDLFEPIIFCVYYDYNENLDKSFHKQGELNYLYFKNRGYNVIYGYDEVTGEHIPMHEFNPDIVILNDPYLWRYSSFKNNILNFNYLTCYIPYGMNIVNNFEYHYNWPNINAMWKNFVPNNYDYTCQIKNGYFYGLNVISYGYPKLDEYKKDESEINIPEKISNGRPIVIYAPHWSVKDNSNNISTFHLYYKDFEELREKYKDINFVFKPHPNLRLRIKQLQDDPTIMSLDEYDKYVEDWNASTNGIVVDDENYIDLFRKSAALFTDCGSFIGEYAYSNHPCIYLVNPDTKHFGHIKDSFMDKYNEFGKSLLKTYYICNDSQDIQKYFTECVLEGKDIYSASRYEIIKNDMKYVGVAGKKIVEYLESILK